MILMDTVWTQTLAICDMDSLKLNENPCRICLKHNALLNWNDEVFEFCGVSYKDCYYKYTKLEETDSEFYPTNLCEMCANELKNAHLLFEKALDSFNTLCAIIANKPLDSDLDISNTFPDMKCEIKILNECHSSVNDEIKGTEGEICSPLCEYKGDTKTENVINFSETSTKEVVTIEPSHFIDIQNLESSGEIPLEYHPRKIRNNELPKSSATNKTRSKGRKCESPTTLSEEELSETCNVRLPKSTTTKKAGIRKRKRESSTEAFGKEENAISSDQNLSDITKDRNSVLSTTTKPTKKSRKKYFLMCAYCSLKVEGASRLKKHEATHNEDRQRTEVCPQCGVRLYTKLSLTRHMKIHDENRQKNQKCEFCEKAFFNKGALNVHRRVHLGLMIKCQICPKEFFRQVDLDKHLLNHSASPLQKNVEKKKYTVECQYCNKSVFTDKWKQHLAVHLDQPQVKCKICDKKFFARSNCTKHLKQVHLKKLSEYEEFIHYYGGRYKRMTSLMMKQQFSVQPLTK